MPDATNRTNEPRKLPIMLWQVMLEEYRALKILDADDEVRIIELNDKLKSSYGLDKKGDHLSRDEETERLRARGRVHCALLAEVRKKVHGRKADAPITALCLSGGGIRSATFALGVIQCLAKNKLLDKFHYLSSVSGGGYIASWLSAWIYRTGETNHVGRDPLDVTSASTIQERLDHRTAELPEPHEITHLRSYSNYMSPRTGLFSTDTWALIAVYLRNLLLNWTVITPFLAAILLLPKLLLLRFDPIGGDLNSTLTMIAILLGLVCVISINLLRPSFKNYSLFHSGYHTDEIGTVKSSSIIVTLTCLLPLLLFSLCLSLQAAWYPDHKLTLPSSILLGVVLLLGGYLLSWALMVWNFISYWRKKKSDPNYKGRSNEPKTLTAWIKSKYAIYLREVIVSALCGVLGGLILYFVEAKVLADPASILGIPRAQFLLCLGVPIFLTVFLLTATLFIGFGVRALGDDDREWATRFGAIVMKTIAIWLVVTCAVIFGPILLGWVFSDTFWAPVKALAITLAGIFSAIAGFSRKTPAQENEPTASRSGLVLMVASSILAPIAVLFFLMSISLATDYLQYTILAGAPYLAYHKTLLFVVFVVVGSIMGAFVNINKFSLHAAYRERLIRAYLGASNRDRQKNANSFTGLDTEADNIEMKDLRQRPLHVLNMALNMVKSDNLAWQNRKAESFTVTALHSGSSQMGKSGNFRESSRYGMNKQVERAITLGTSAAISGAAASPNMGHFTQSTAVTFLMVLLNVRLGWWLGNPGRRGNRTDAWQRSAPRWSPMEFLYESLGSTDDTHPYVYLADGGQFENLGLYEMVVRRCKLIVLCDGGADPKFGYFDLANAMHKIKVDMGVPIEFEAGHKPKQKKYSAIAKIKYSAVDGPAAEDGILIYLKPTLKGSEPTDIQHYSKENLAFPHETTVDQFYSESQFESYRSLGFHAMNALSAGNAIAGLNDLLTNIRTNKA